MIVVDTSVVVAYMNACDDHHDAVSEWLTDVDDDLVTAPLIVAERYADLDLGLADASLVTLADRYGTVAVATLDERHFRAVRPISSGPSFQLLPADAPD